MGMSDNTVLFFFIIPVCFFLFLLIMDMKEYVYESFENPFYERKPYSNNLEKEDITFEQQYLDTLSINEIEDKKSVFYEDDICKDYNSDNDGHFSLTRELSCTDFDNYTKQINNKNNLALIDDSPSIYKIFKNIKPDEWNEKKVLSKRTYEALKPADILEKELDDFKSNNINGSNKIQYVDVAVNKFIEDLNKNFEKSEFNKKYNKHHVFESYRLENYRFKRYFYFKKDNVLYERTIVIFKIFRPYKVNSFISLLDIYYASKEDNQNNTNLSNFLDNYYIYYKNCYVIGNPVRHRSSFLEEDNTNFIQSNFQIFNNEMYIKLKEIEKLKKNENPNIEAEDIFKQLFSELKDIDTKKSFNSITYKNYLYKFRKLILSYQSKPKSTKIQLYEDLVNIFIKNSEEILQSQNAKKKDLNKNIPFKNSDLEGQKIMTDELTKLWDSKKDNILSLSEEIKKKINERNNKYKCFNPKHEDIILDKYNTRVSCISYHDDIGVKGVYDKYCEKDEECPFFQSNLNYPNDFGGCKAGKCQMPVGIGTVGGTKVSNIGNLYCYNCGKYNLEGDTYQSYGRCCSLQNKDKDFKSPDFMFPNDKRLRFKHRKYLEDNGLKY